MREAALIASQRLSEDGTARLWNADLYVCSRRPLRGTEVAEALPAAIPQPGHLLRGCGQSLAGRFCRYLQTAAVQGYRSIYAAGRHYDDGDMRL